MLHFHSKYDSWLLIRLTVYLNIRSVKENNNKNQSNHLLLRKTKIYKHTDKTRNLPFVQKTTGKGQHHHLNKKGPLTKLKHGQLDNMYVSMSKQITINRDWTRPCFSMSVCVFKKFTFSIFTLNLLDYIFSYDEEKKSSLIQQGLICKIYDKSLKGESLCLCLFNEYKDRS